jgi:colicin V production protein
MSLDFTNLALAIVVVFGLIGWIRGIRRVAVTTGGIFFGMAVVGLLGADLITSFSKVGIQFHPKTLADLFLALLFVFTVYIVQLGGVLLILGQKNRPSTRRERFNGLLLGLVNGFLVVANAMRYADPYLRATANPTTGGWTWRLPLPRLGHPDAGTFSFSIDPTNLTITPSPLLKIYDSLPTALILLFAFLLFVFVGTLYGRVIRARG